MKKGVGILVSGISILSLAVTSIAVGVSFALYTNDDDVKSDGTSGEISLRSYYECGTGTELDPYIITRPRHLYNLSRLQSLGVYGSKTYFQLGKVGLNGDNSGLPVCYLDDSSMTTVPFLDMSSSNYSYEPINAIGSEAVPFYGEFNGQNAEIKNLTVYANPEDAGLFGYTAHGSKVHNLFLSNVTINALGYTSEFANLYGPSSTAGNGASFSYSVDDYDTTFLITDTAKVESLSFDASAIFNWDGISDEPVISTPAPIIGPSSSNPSYRYKILISGDFLKDNGDGTVSVDLPTVYKFFKKEKAETTSFPLNASSSISLVASTTDNNGLDHSKVVMTMMFDFSLASSETNYLTMNAHLSSKHTNNIGLIIGHCDGTISDCYVYNGGFVMNNGSDFSDATYYTLENGSNYGLIGLIGGTVHNIMATESDSGTSAGKDIGVLDFTTVYKDIITSSSFNNSQSLSPDGVTYVPSDSLQYRDFLRKNGAGQYVTLEQNSVSFNRQKIITNADLGIFTIATDKTGTGMNEDATNDLNNSVVKYEDVSVNSSYYVYYSTGEYQKTNGIEYDNYREAIKTNTPSDFYPGYHFPLYNQITTASFDQRNRHQNYVFRFKVSGDYRTGKGFYFSDVDKTTAGGSFVSHYFENILVDQNGNPIPASLNSAKSGVMLRNSLGQEIRSFSSSFATPDLSAEGSKMYCISNATYNDPAANMVNFEVKTEVANVTIISGLADPSKAAAVGIYKIDGEERKTSDNLKYIDRDYNDPDYAYFMPTDDHLAYFDYTVDNVGTGHIGVYEYDDVNDEFTFKEADTHTNATMPASYEVTSCEGGEYGYDSAQTRTRLYAHTFKLPQGKYCVGSATGTANDGEGIAEIYYLCAQGQTDGQISFDDNAFASQDEVKNVDFLKKECFTYNENTGVTVQNITMGEAQEYDPENSTLIENHRCYVGLVNSDRSLFKDQYCDVRFEYSNGKFRITSSTLGAITYFAVSNYASSHASLGIPNTVVTLFGGEDSTAAKIFYPST